MTGVAELDEVHYDLEVDGEQVRRQLSRKVWERGSWATIAVTFVERDRDGEWKPPEFALLRFRKLHGSWQRQGVVTAPLDEIAAFVGAS